MFLLVIAEILNPRVEDMLYLLGNFSGCFAGGGFGVHNSPFTHTHVFAHIMRAALHPGLRNPRIRRGCVAMSMRMYFPFWLCENPS